MEADNVFQESPGWVLCLADGTELSVELGMMYLQRADELGNLDAMGTLGDCYLNGVGVQQDFEK